ncbi:MAG: response regulator transcription factor [Alphaproteobacteria bacterium]|nr:response regulator transcription factor [Alphaproteobacteria bacterium]
MIRLFVIEDHLMVILSSFRFLFRPQRDGITISGSAESIDDVILKASPLDFDIFILDLHIPNHQPIDNVKNLKQHFPDKPIIIYTGEKSAIWKSRMFHEGVSAYITKDSTREELKLAIQKVAQGERFNVFIQEISKKNYNPDDSTIDNPKFTTLQRSILSYLANGSTHKEISDKIGVSRSMIEKILKSMRESFKVKNNLELIKLLSKAGSV